MTGKNKIYSVKKYKLLKSEWESKAFEGDIDSIVMKIKEDNFYNERLSKDSLVKFFLDIEVDGLVISEIVKALIDFFNNKLKLKLKEKDIKYTSNDLKFNRVGSYHIVIPKYYSVNSALKEIASEITKLYLIPIDPSVYGDKWFRLPNQTGLASKPKYAHKIQNGKLKDFVLQYVDKTNSVSMKKYFNAYSIVANSVIEVAEKKTQPVTVKKIENKITSNIDNLDLLLDALPIKWLDEYDNWFKLGALLYSIGSTLEKWIETSSKSSKYVEGCCNEKWTKYKTHQYSIKSLYYWVKRENLEAYNKISNSSSEWDWEKPVVETKKISLSHLTKKENDVLTIQDELIPYFDDLFVNNKFKSVNIKSPYGTSKTQLIKKVIEKYNPKKILWLSFRQTLTDDIQNNFKDLNFKHYQDKKLDEDRLIIQLESLLKLRSFEELEEGADGEIYNITAEYDLIMLDEIESLLRQFDSEKTFKDQSRIIFEYLEQLLKKCKHIISLDGDLDNRSYSFLKSFGSGLFLENTVKANNKILKLTDEVNEFDNEIKDLLGKNKKLVIASMSSEKSKYYYDYIKDKFPKLTVTYYTGSSDAKEKSKDLKNVNEEWLKKDVIIYSPTIEAGVSFDVPNHFYKIFGIVNGCSTSQRSFYQMLARVRNPVSNEITILNDGLKGKSNCFFSFDEVKLAMSESRKLKITYAEGKSKTAIDLYDINSIYNKVEALNKSNGLFIPYLIKLGERKQYTIVKSTSTQLKEEKLKQDSDRKEFKENREDGKASILNAPNITHDNFTILNELKKERLISEQDDLKLSRKSLQYKIGLELNEELVNCYYKNESTIDNFSLLVDDANMKNVDDSFVENKKKQVLLIKELFKVFDINCFSTTTFNNTLFLQKIKNLDIYTTTNQIIFNKEKITIDTEKKSVKYINSILENYNLTFRVFYKGQKVETNKAYSFERLNYIEEIMYWKRVRGKVQDTNKLIKCPKKLLFESNFTYYRDKFNKVLAEIVNIETSSRHLDDKTLYEYFFGKN